MPELKITLDGETVNSVASEGVSVTVTFCAGCLESATVMLSVAPLSVTDVEPPVSVSVIAETALESIELTSTVALLIPVS